MIPPTRAPLAAFALILLSMLFIAFDAFSIYICCKALPFNKDDPFGTACLSLWGIYSAAHALWNGNLLWERVLEIKRYLLRHRAHHRLLDVFD